MTSTKIIHLKEQCISCGACAAISPQFWEMDQEGMAHLKGSVQNGKDWTLVVKTVEAAAANKEAADVCPVNIIKFEEEKK
jgi:ferredoxin